MNIKQLLGAICAMIIKVALAAAIICVVFRLAVSAYDFGYQVFVDLPVSEGPGRTISVTVSEGQSGRALAETLEQQGLIRDKNVFYIVMLLSEYKDDLKAGTYELSTAMSCAQMLEVLCNAQNPEEAQQ